MQLEKIDRNINYRMREFNGEYFLFGEGKSFSVNQMGKITWMAVGKGFTFEELVDRVILKFDLQPEDKERVEADISEFIDSLIKVGALDIDE